MLPYKRQGEIDYSKLDFDPFDSSEKPCGMQQKPSMSEVEFIFNNHFTNFRKSPNVFAETDVNICRAKNLSRHISPDVCLAFGVDDRAIRDRALYLPWEVGKPPDWVLEVGSESTGKIDVGTKVADYEELGVQEYWRFDPTGGKYHGAALGGDILVNGKYQPVDLTTQPDGVLKAYSPLLGLYLCWIPQPEGLALPGFYNAVADEYLENAEEVVAARRAAEARADAAEAERDYERQQRLAAESEVQRLRRELRRHTSN